MSLISDALKQGQRERSKQQSSGASPQPLLEGFFPYVATSPAPQGRSRRTLIAVIALSSVLLIGVAGWLTLPAIRRTLAARSQKAGTVSPPRQVVRASLAQPPVTGAPTDSSRAVGQGRTASTDRRTDNGPTTSPLISPTRQAIEQEPAVIPRQKTAAIPAGPVAARSDTIIARPGALIEQTPPAVSRGGGRVSVDYEARATELFNLGDLQGARENFVLATRYAPTARAWTNYGVTLQKLGDLASASAAYQTAIGIDGNYLEAWLYQGRVAKIMGEPQRSIPLFQRARSINPRHSEVNTELAELEANARNWTEARRFAGEAVRADPANSRAHWFLATSADQLSDSEMAIREYTAYLQTIGSAEKENLASVGYARTRLQQLRGKP